MSTVHSTDTCVRDNGRVTSADVLSGGFSDPALPDPTVNMRSASTPCLVVEVDGAIERVVPAELADEAVAQQLQERYRRAPEPSVFDISGLFTWPADERWLVMQLIAGIDRDHLVRFDGESDPQTNLFDAMLGMFVGDDDPSCRERINTAVHAAVLVHPDSLRSACRRITERLRNLGVHGYRADRLARDGQGLLASLRAQPDTVLLTIREVLDGIAAEPPVPDDAIVPPGWQMGAQGVARTGSEQPTPVVTTPVVITRRLVDATDRTESLEIAWVRDGVWTRHIVKRGIVATRHSIVELADRGLPVTSNNAADVVGFLSDFEAANIEVLPVDRVTQHLGWQGQDLSDGFLWGHELIRECSDTVEQDQPHVPISFRGSDEGDEQLVSGYRAEGTLEGWQEAIAELDQFPRIKFALYAALTPPLLGILSSPNFIVSFSGATSQGKTTALRIAASCWGCPDERSPEAILGTWDATRVWIEHASEVRSHLPLILDDTKRARREQDVAQTLYDVHSGRGRGRGSPTGVRHVGTWTTVMLTSGEAPITSFSQDGGTRARVLELWGSPFGAVSEETAGIVNQVSQLVFENNGWAGRQFVQFVLDNRGRWPAWREHYAQVVQRYQRRAGTNSVAGRMAANFAALRLTAVLAHQAGVLPWRYRNVVGQLWPELVAETPEADRAAAAMRYVLSWAQSHANAFCDCTDEPRRTPPSGWAGRWDRGATRRGELWLGFFPHYLDELLREAGFDHAAILRQWKDRDWLLCDRSSGKARYRARIPDGEQAGLAWLVAIRREAAIEADAVASSEEGGEEPQLVQTAADGEQGNAGGTLGGTP